MAFSRPTLKTIYDRIIADMEARLTAATPGVTQVKIKKISLYGILAAVFAGVIHMVYGYLSYLAKQLLADTADEEWLVRLAELNNVTRNPATFADGIATFTGTNGTVIAAGTLIQTSDLVQFTTQADVEIALGTVSVAIEAVVSGTSGNTLLSAALMVSPIAGVDSNVTISTLPTGGAEQETIEALRQRLLIKIRQPPAGGRAYDYEAWAKEVAGITRAWAVDAYNGAGTVGVIVADGASPVSGTILSNCVAYIEERKPLGSVVYVDNIVPVTCNFAIYLPSGEANKATTITSQLSQLFFDEGAPGETILISHIQSAILASLVSDYTITTLTVGGTPITVGNIVMTGKDVAVFGTATYGVM